MPFDADGVEPSHIHSRAQFTAALNAIAGGRTRREIAALAGAPEGTVLGWFAGTIPGLDTPYLAPVLRVCGVAEAKIPAWRAAADRVLRTPTRTPKSVPAPYPGLPPYDSSCAADFFGRDDLIAGLRAAVRNCLDGDGPGIVIVIGESGAGKSSLLLAGLQPGFTDVAVLTPGPQPHAALLRALDTLNSRSDADLVLVVDQCEELWTLAPTGDGVDDALDVRWRQLREDFLAELSGWAGRPRTAVVIGLRADLFGFAAADPFLRRGLDEGRLIPVTPMNRDQLLDVIRAPAGRRGVTVQPALVERLLEELKVTEHGSDGGALPLLCHALQQTWTGATLAGNVLTYEDYFHTGGIKKAVERTAERVYGYLDEHERRVARRIVTRCVVVTEEATARRRVHRGELVWSDTPQSVVDSVIDRFAAARLLTVTESGVQLTHEALVTAWPRLSGWIDTDRVTLQRHRRLGAEAHLWADGGRREQDLLTHGRTDEFQEWADTEDRYKELTVLEREYLAACTAHWAAVTERDRRRVQELAHTVDELGRTVRQRDTTVRALERSERKLLRGIVALIVVAVVAFTSAVVAGVVSSALLRSQSALRDTRDQALSRQAAAQSELLRGRDPGLAQQLALAGYNIAHTVEARSALLDSSAIPAPVRTPTVPGPLGTALDKKGTLLAVVNSDGTARLIDRRLPRRGPTAVWSVANDRLYAVAFAPNRPVLAIGGGTTLTLWDISIPSQPAQKIIDLPTGRVKTNHLAWSPDGSELAAATDTGVQRWRIGDDIRSVIAAPPLNTGKTNAVAFSPDGGVLAAGGDGLAIQLWHRGSGALPTPVGSLPIGSVVLDLQFDPTSKRLAVGSQATDAYLLDVSDPIHPTITSRLGPFTSYVYSVAFDPDGTIIVAGSADNSTQLFDTATAVAAATPEIRPMRILPGSQLVLSVAVTTDTVIDTCTDGVVREWALRDGLTSDYLGGRIFTLPTSADGSSALVGLVAPQGSPANVVNRFEFGPSGVMRPVQPSLPLAPGARLSGVAAISDDGRTAASGTTGGDIELWDLGDASNPRRAAPPLHIVGAQIAAAVFTHDARYLYAASNADESDSIAVIDRTDPANPRIARTLRAASLVQLLTVSADNTLLAVATATDVEVWDISGGPGKIFRRNSFMGFGSTATAVRFGPGHLLAAGSDDETIRLWDPTGPAASVEPEPLAGPTGSVESLTFDPSGTRLAAGIGDTQILIWDTTDPRHPVGFATLTAYGGRVNDVAYGPGGAYLTAAGPAGVLRTWATNPDAVIGALCRNPASVITKTEWAQQLPNAEYRNPCPR